MHKYIFFLFTTIFLFLPLEEVQNSSANENSFIFTTPTPPLKSTLEIKSFELDRNAVVSSCPYNYPHRTVCQDNGLINVSTFATGKNTITYHYTVSAGKIEGEGAKVVWNLREIPVGDYTITVEVNDNSKAKRRAATRNIKVYDCDCHPIPKPCNCPAISITTPKSFIVAGENVTFIANIKNKSEEKLIYDWTASQGEIIEGQGTRQIKVRTESEAYGKDLTVTLNINGINPECGCETFASKTVSITSKSK